MTCELRVLYISCIYDVSEYKANLAFLLSGNRTLQGNFSRFDTKIPLITQLETFHN